MLKTLVLTVISVFLLISLASASYTVLDGEMNQTYTLTVTYIDANGTILNGVSVTDSLGFTTTATYGSWSNTYDYGEVSFTSSKSGYATVTSTLIIDNDTSMNVTMTSATGGQNVNYYNPHQVRFMCRDYLGKPIEGMSVTAVGVQTTLGALDWVLTLFGINLDSTPILTTSMSGTTGYDGSIVFLMLESEKYKLTFIKPELSINESRYYYPKEDEYDEVFWTETPQYSSQAIVYSFENSSVNATFTRLGIKIINYATLSSELTSTEFFVDNATYGSSGETVASTVNFAATSTGDNTTFYTDVPNIMGGGYVWGFSFTDANYSSPINASKLYIFEDYQWKINPLGASNGDPTATTVYNYAAVGLIALFAFMFSRANIKFGVVVVPLVAALFQYIGWLTTGWFIVSIAMAMGVILYLRYAEEESGL